MAHPVRSVVAGLVTAVVLAGCSSSVTGGVDAAPAATVAASAPSTAAPPTTDDPTTSAEPLGTVATTATTVTTAAPTTATPTTATAATATGAVPRVLLVGDGILWDATPALQAALDALGVVSRFESYWGFGLTKPEHRDWPALWPQYVVEEQPDVVVVSSGPNDALPRPGPDGTLLAPGDPGWAAWYGGLLDRAAAILTADGAHVLWLGMLWPGQPEATPATVALNDAMRALVARNPAVTYVDAPSGVGGPDGRYAEFAGSARLRKPDGEHLCVEGAARFAVVVTTALEHELGRPVDPAFATGAWRSGEWRVNGRYDMDGGEACSG